MGIYGVAGMPHKGWIAVAVIDRGEGGEQLCECCVARMVRYAHVVTHPDVPDTIMEVGCVCAEAITEDYNGKEAERKARNRADRRDKLRGKFGKDKSWVMVKGDLYKITDCHRIFRYSLICSDPSQNQENVGPFLSRDLALDDLVVRAIP